MPDTSVGTNLLSAVSVGSVDVATISVGSVVVWPPVVATPPSATLLNAPYQNSVRGVNAHQTAQFTAPAGLLTIHLTEVSGTGNQYDTIDIADIGAFGRTLGTGTALTPVINERQGRVNSFIYQTTVAAGDYSVDINVQDALGTRSCTIGVFHWANCSGIGATAVVPSIAGTISMPITTTQPNSVVCHDVAKGWVLNEPIVFGAGEVDSETAQYESIATGGSAFDDHQWKLGFRAVPTPGPITTTATWTGATVTNGPGLSMEMLP